MSELNIIMNYIFWNVRELGSNAKRRVLREVVIAYQPDIICLTETKINNPNQLVMRQLNTKKKKKPRGWLKTERGCREEY